MCITESSFCSTSVDSLVIVDSQRLSTGTTVQDHHIQMVEGALQVCAVYGGNTTGNTTNTNTPKLDKYMVVKDEVVAAPKFDAGIATIYS